LRLSQVAGVATMGKKGQKWSEYAGVGGAALSHLKRIANSSTHEAHDSAVATLKNLPLYKGKSNVQNYLSNVWVSCSFVFSFILPHFK